MYRCDVTCRTLLISTTSNTEEYRLLNLVPLYKIALENLLKRQIFSHTIYLFVV